MRSSKFLERLPTPDSDCRVRKSQTLTPTSGPKLDFDSDARTRAYDSEGLLGAKPPPPEMSEPSRRPVVDHSLLIKKLNLTQNSPFLCQKFKKKFGKGPHRSSNMSPAGIIFRLRPCWDLLCYSVQRSIHTEMFKNFSCLFYFLFIGLIMKSFKYFNLKSLMTCSDKKCGILHKATSAQNPGGCPAGFWPYPELPPPRRRRIV